MTNNNLIRDLDKLSQLDPGGVLKDAHDFPGHRLRVADVVSAVQSHYTHFEVTYDSDNNPTVICYYEGISPHITTVGMVADVAGSLNNTYFFIHEGRTEKRFHVWYNVSGGGTDPAPDPNSTPIQVDIATNDPAAIIAQATASTINSLFSEFFSANRTNGAIEVTCIKFGETDNSIDGNTSFVIANTAGTEQQVEKVRIDYDAQGNPIYEGETLIGYEYNIFTGKFELDDTRDENTITNETIYNIDVNAINTEFSHTLTDGTKEYMIRTRDKKSVLKLAFNSGESGTNFVTISGISNYSSINLKSIGRTLYFQTPTQPTIVEIVEKS